MDKKLYIIESAFESYGFRCVVVFNGRTGGRCGYVAVPAWHPLAGRNLNDVSEAIEMHGGCSYAENGSGGYPEPGQYGWIGFDCLHAWDARDCSAWEKYFPEIYHQWKINDLLFHCPDCSVRTLSYCEGQCRSIARQLAAISRKRDIQCTQRDCRYYCLPEGDQHSSGASGACRCPAIAIEKDVFSGECLNFQMIKDGHEKN